MGAGDNERELRAPDSTVDNKSQGPAAQPGGATPFSRLLQRKIQRRALQRKVDPEQDEDGHEHEDHEHGDHGHGDFEEAKGKKKALHAVRFSNDPKLVAVAGGKGKIKLGDTGLFVTHIAQALADLGDLAAAKVSDKFDADLEAAVKKFQGAHKVKASGHVDKKTMQALDGALSGYSAEAAIAKGLKPSTLPTEGKPYDVGKAPKELTAGTRALTDGDRAAVAGAISTEQQVDPKTGKLPEFKKKKAKQYEKEIKKQVNEVVDIYLVGAKSMDKERSAGHLYDWKDIDAAANESKKATDAVFGSYAVGKPLKGSGVDPKIKDAWDSKEKDLGADASLADDWADWRVEKILTGDDGIAAIDRQYNAIQSRPDEEPIITRVKSEVVAARKADLVLIHKSWPAFASGGKVFVQRVQETNKKGNVDKSKGRSAMWDMFQTVIHEYIHTLEHPEHVKYRGTMTQQKGNFTLREGVTDYFTKIAYNATDRNDATLRKNVEGPFHENGVTHKVADLTTYGESINAERMAAIVGFPNVAAAFFLGQVELIGKK